ncbi:MAG TPA: lactonase family protein [Planctomycetaceae bacterium]|jgi:6-phosphogluconolactonase|nr:lactonase family protein [Planctomycetaceae bacterium]
MKLALLLLFVSVAVVAARSSARGAEGTERVYFGTYAEKPNQGIFVAELDLASGVVSPPRLAARTTNPSFLAFDPSHKFLYAVAEVSMLGGKRTGGVIAFAVDGPTGRLTRLNEEPSHGAGPCHLVVDKTGKNVLVANYEGGTAAVLPILDGGRLKSASSWVTHHGKGPNPERQEQAHAHSINLDAANRFAFVADLGLDKVFVYHFDAAAGSLKANDPNFVAVAPGAGPRHFAFHPTGRFAYVIDELASTITAFWYDADNGTLATFQTVSTLPKDFKGSNTGAEVVVHPSGKFVYGSNRGHDSIAMFSVDAATGRLTSVGHEPTQGKTPRNFAVDPTGNYLLAANQDSDTVVVFRVDPATGRLKPTGQTLKIHMPVCIKYVK